jgi:hypothetical protein
LILIPSEHQAPEEARNELEEVVCLRPRVHDPTAQLRIPRCKERATSLHRREAGGRWPRGGRRPTSSGTGAQIAGARRLNSIGFPFFLTWTRKPKSGGGWLALIPSFDRWQVSPKGLFWPRLESGTLDSPFFRFSRLKHVQMNIHAISVRFDSINTYGINYKKYRYKISITPGLFNAVMTRVHCT